MKANPYVWNYGNFITKNLSNGDEVNIVLKNKGWVSKKDFTIKGEVKDANGQIK